MSVPHGRPKGRSEENRAAQRRPTVTPSREGAGGRGTMSVPHGRPPASRMQRGCTKGRSHENGAARRRTPVTTCRAEGVGGRGVL